MFQVSKGSLGSDVVAAIPKAKREFQLGKAASHRGDELARLITFARGAKLYEFQVGQAHGRDPFGAGKRRLVLYAESGQIKRVFFNLRHYDPNSWVEIIDC